MKPTKFLPPLFTLLIITLTIIASSTQPLHPSQQSNLPSSPTKDFPFQRILWTYWNSNTTQPPIIVQLCIDNMALVASKYNFTFILVNQSNVRQYVNNYDELFLQVRKKSIQKSFTHAADLLRMLIIQQHGGIWVDTTTIFLNGLTQIQNIMSQQYEHLIANRFAPRPQAMFFYEANGQNRIQHHIRNPSNPSSQPILYNQYPDYQIWSIFSARKSPFISQIRQTYSLFTTTPFLLTQQLFISQDIFISYIDNNYDYLYLNMAVTYTLQKKQMELDRELHLFGQRKFAFEYYKVWGLHAEYGPMVTTREDLIPFDYLFWYSKQQLLQMGFNFRFFMKQFGYIRKVTQQKFNVLLKYFDNNHMTFMDFLYNYMDKPTCQQITFIVEGSIIDQLLAKSDVDKRHRFLILTKAQNEEWLQHCAWKDTFWDKLQKKWKPYHETISLYKGFYYKVHKAKAESLLYQNDDLSIMEWLKITYNDNFFLIYEFIYMTVIALILFGTWVVIRWGVAKWFRGTIMFSEEEDVIGMGTSQESVRSTAPEYSQKTIKKQHTRVLLLTFALVVLTMFMFNAVDVLGGRDQPQTILLCVFLIFLAQSYIEQQLSMMKQLNYPKFIRLNSLYQLFFMTINYLCGFLCLVHVWRNRFWLNWFAQVLGMVGPCLFKLKRVMDIKASPQKSYQASYHTSNNHQTFTQKALYKIRSNPHRCTILLFLLITILLPNLRHMSGQSGYYIKYVSIIPSIYLLIIFLSTLIRCLSHKYYRQLTRLLLLIMISLRLYLTINQIDTLVQKLPRVSFFAMNVVVMSLVYIQIASQVQEKSYKTNVFTNLSITSFQWLFLILPLLIELILGLFIFNHYTMGSAFIDYYLHYIFFVYNAVVAVCLSLMRKEEGTEVRGNITQMKSVEFGVFEEEEYDRVGDQ